MRVRVAIAMLWAALQLPLAAAQSANLAGTWALEAAATESQTSDGERWSLTALSGTLTLEQKGEGVTGSWKGRSPDPWSLTGRAQGTTFELQTEVASCRVLRNGEKGTVRRIGSSAAASKATS